MKRLVKIKTRDKRYATGTPYPFLPAQCKDTGIYLTGQIVNPRDPSTSGYLTLEEATGTRQISAEKLKLFPYIINPFDVHSVRRDEVMDLSVDDNGNPMNAKDTALYNMFVLHSNTFAKNELVYNQEKNIFYFNDEQAVAEETISRKRLLAQSLSIIFELSPERQKDVALLLSVYDHEFRTNPDHVSQAILEDKIVKSVEKNPLLMKGIFQSNNDFTKKAEEDLFIAKLVHVKEITIKIKDFYYQNTYLGNSTEEVKKWMRDKNNSTTVAKWNAIISKANAGEVVAKTEKPKVIETGTNQKSN